MRLKFSIPMAVLVAVSILISVTPLAAQQISLGALVTPSTVIIKDGHPVTFAVHGFIEFNSLAELFPYVESQAKRWPLSSAEAQALERDVLRRGIESRVVSMSDPRPFETLITHTGAELRQAIAEVKEPTPPGYLDAFLAVQNKWKHSLNCWSAAPEIPARVLSNWYPIEEGIQLYGSTYDSAEHFWQAVKYHPAITVGELKGLLEAAEQRDWGDWLKRLDADPKFYLPNAYAVEFLRHNLARDRLRWFRDELRKHDLKDSDRAREVQQRAVANDFQKNATPAHAFRFNPYEEKVLWGDLADVFHLVYTFSPAEDPMRRLLAEHHFDGIYLGEQKLGFISEEYRSLMLEIWKVKYLETARFGEVIRSIPDEIRLEHFLNDGDSPDIPIPVYVGYLNRIREMARHR
jgi:hypothetical protein